MLAYSAETQVCHRSYIIAANVEVVLVQSAVVHVNSGNENDHLGNRPKHPHFLLNKNYLSTCPHFFFFFCQNE